MGIRAALTALVEYQEAISITSPANIRVKKAFNTIPNQNSALPNPCFMNSFTLIEEVRGGGLRELMYDIRMQFAYYDADQDKAADVVAAFMDAIVNKFDMVIKFGGVIGNSDLSGGTPTLVSIPWNGIDYVGLDLHLAVNIKDAVEFSGG